MPARSRRAQSHAATEYVGLASLDLLTGTIADFCA